MTRINKNLKKIVPLIKVDLRERKQERLFNFILIILTISLFLFVIFILKLSYYNDSENELAKIDILINNNDKIISKIEPQEKIINTDSLIIIEKLFNIEENKVLDIVKRKKIYQMKSSEPDGFYIMIGIFSDYENAVNLERTHGTKFKCHIFESNNNGLYQVGLFVSKNEHKSAKKALLQVRNIHIGSWLLYNSKK